MHSFEALNPLMSDAVPVGVVVFNDCVQAGFQEILVDAVILVELTASL